jgi:hypothetical protein
MPEQLLTREEFLDWLRSNYSAWAADKPRSLQDWLYSVKQFMNEEKGI